MARTNTLTYFAAMLETNLKKSLRVGSNKLVSLARILGLIKNV